MKSTNNLQKIYFKIFKQIKDLDINEVYTLLESLKEGFEAYDFLSYNTDHDEIENIEEDLEAKND